MYEGEITGVHSQTCSSSLVPRVQCEDHGVHQQCCWDADLTRTAVHEIDRYLDTFFWTFCIDRS